MTYKLDDTGRKAAAKIVQEWTDIAFSTGRATDAEREQIKDNVEALYRAADLAPPPRHRIVIAPSPFVARFAAGAASWIWHCRKGATDEATSATRDATRDAASAAANAATRRATRNAANEATSDALAAKGHTVERLADMTYKTSGVCAITADLETGILEGGADPRRMSRAMGW